MPTDHHDIPKHPTRKMYDDIVADLHETVSTSFRKCSVRAWRVAGFCAALSGQHEPVTGSAQYRTNFAKGYRVAYWLVREGMPSK